MGAAADQTDWAGVQTARSAHLSRRGNAQPQRACVTCVGFDSEFVSVRRLVDSAVSRLRAKLEVDPDNPELILTVRGVGYIFRRLHHQPVGSQQAGDDDVIDLDAWRARQWGLPPP